MTVRKLVTLMRSSSLLSLSHYSSASAQGAATGDLHVTVRDSKEDGAMPGHHRHDYGTRSGEKVWSVLEPTIATPNTASCCCHAWNLPRLRSERPRASPKATVDRANGNHGGAMAELPVNGTR